MNRSTPVRGTQRPTGQPALVPGNTGGGQPIDPMSGDVRGGKPPLTPALVHASSAESLKSNRWSLRPNEWQQIQVDRASVVVTLDVTDGQLLYNYGQLPISTADAQVAERGGVCMLQGAGVWWLRYAGSTAINLLTVDAWHPSASSKYGSQAGAARVVHSLVDLSATGTASSIEILAANRFRVGAVIQNVRIGGTNGGIVRVSLDQPASYLDTGAPNDRGLMLVAGGTLTLGGDSLARGSVRAIVDLGGAVVAKLEVVEFRND